MNMIFYTTLSENCSFTKAEQETITTVIYVQVVCKSYTEKLFSDM